MDEPQMTLQVLMQKRPEEDFQVEQKSLIMRYMDRTYGKVLLDDTAADALQDVICKNRKRCSKADIDEFLDELNEKGAGI